VNYHIIKKDVFLTGNYAAIFTFFSFTFWWSKMDKSPKIRKKASLQVGRLPRTVLWSKMFKCPQIRKKAAVQFGSMPPYSLVEVPSWPPEQKRTTWPGHVTGGNECKSVISAWSGLTVSRPFYIMAVSALRMILALTFKVNVNLKSAIFQNGGQCALFESNVNEPLFKVGHFTIWLFKKNDFKFAILKNGYQFTIFTWSQASKSASAPHL